MWTVQDIFYPALWSAIAIIVFTLYCLQFTDARQFQNTGHNYLTHGST
jgi:hypothetical protein